MKTRGIVLAAATVLAGVFGAIYYFVDPNDTQWMPRCLFHTLTGLDCPGCGAQRMAHALLHGDFSGAWEANSFLLLALPLLLFLLVLEVLVIIYPDKTTRLYRRVYGPATAPIAGILLVGWFVVRNFVWT